jgi:valyl-tRNA synthetase
MENIRDWPISRQIWWGIPIPVKYCGDCNEAMVDIDNTVTACTKCNSQKLNADNDTFDTWFSSGQWPYATMLANDAKHGTKTFAEFYPTDVMETGWDILFFWIARMVMFSYYRFNKPPFKKVFLHGLVRDKDRQKMSKSKGNVIDPLGVIDTYGTDALRFALIFSTAAGNDIPLAEDKIKGMKHFGNKLWNIARYILATDPQPGEAKAVTDADKAIMQELAAATKAVTDGIANFKIHEAAQAIYDFTWYKLADVYIEASKPQIADATQAANTKALLLHQLTSVLKLLHPFMPFITEQLWQELRERKLVTEELLMVVQWPSKL